MGFRSSSGARDSALQDSTEAEWRDSRKNWDWKGSRGHMEQAPAQGGAVQRQSLLPPAPGGFQGWRCQGLPGQNCFPLCWWKLQPFVIMQCPVTVCLRVWQAPLSPALSLQFLPPVKHCAIPFWCLWAEDVEHSPTISPPKCSAVRLWPMDDDALHFLQASQMIHPPTLNLLSSALMRSWELKNPYGRDWQCVSTNSFHEMADNSPK